MKTYNYKGYKLVKNGNAWDVYATEVFMCNGKRMERDIKIASQYSNLLTAKRACDAHFGRL